MAEHPDDPITVTSAFPPRDTAPGGYLEPIRAAGAVLWRGDPTACEVALVHRPDRDDWSLPKGKVKNSEHLLTAAVREVAEETGLHPVLGRRLPPQRYLKDGWPKQVEWWAATASGESDFVPGDEIDAVEWLPLARARRRLTYGHDIQVLDNFASGPAETFPLILLRHASAGDKGSWDDDDLLRPLDATGRGDARELARVLSSLGAPRVVSSAAARCTETMIAYAVAGGVEVRTERAFTAQTAGAETVFDTEAAREAFTALIEEAVPTVVCTHGELVPRLMRAALERLDAPVSQQLSLRKGTFWVLHLSRADLRLAAVERHSVRG
ncbi:NUDIX hydrolase [Streptomonospora sp. PA3]|uniref:NUDIX hydrolase n=1 Tax=Streptomonospora sp. PA3 TaxID=2607326 RepID=UPI0012DE1EF6|nr:NUDIX hydrolase [Streptomonospora sp. PA3]MUL43946.1 NUDIX hydrolase [Streptomonospora sp. PA3]